MPLQLSVQKRHPWQVSSFVLKNTFYIVPFTEISGSTGDNKLYTPVNELRTEPQKKLTRFVPIPWVINLLNAVFYCLSELQISSQNLKAIWWHLPLLSLRTIDLFPVSGSFYPVITFNFLRHVVKRQTPILIFPNPKLRYQGSCAKQSGLTS